MRLIESCIDEIDVHEGVGGTAGFAVVMNLHQEEGVVALGNALCYALGCNVKPYTGFVSEVRAELRADRPLEERSWLWKSNGKTYFSHGMLFDWPAKWLTLGDNAIVYWSQGRLKVANLPDAIALKVVDHLQRNFARKAA